MCLEYHDFAVVLALWAATLRVSLRENRILRSSGRRKTYKDGLPQTSSWERDALGRVTGKTFPDGLAARKFVFKEVVSPKVNGVSQAGASPDLHYRAAAPSLATWFKSRISSG